MIIVLIVAITKYGFSRYLLWSIPFVAFICSYSGIILSAKNGNPPLLLEGDRQKINLALVFLYPLEAAFLEETVYRLFLLNFFEDLSKSKGAGIVISSFIFGLKHRAWYAQRSSGYGP